MGQSSLYVASGYGKTTAVKFLIERGADVNLPVDVCVVGIIITVLCMLYHVVCNIIL